MGLKILQSAGQKKGIYEASGRGSESENMFAFGR